MAIKLNWPGVANAEGMELKFVAVAEPPVVPLVFNKTSVSTAARGMPLAALKAASKDWNVRGLPVGVIGPVGTASRGVVVVTACAAGAAAANAARTGMAMSLRSDMRIRVSEKIFDSPYLSRLRPNEARCFRFDRKPKRAGQAAMVRRAEPRQLSL